MSSCLGDISAALVDGELDHAARERAQRHLAHCAACRAEVEAQRRLKARLSASPAPEPSAALLTRLRGLEAPDAVAAVPARAAVQRPAGRPRRARSVRRRVAAGSALAALGLATAFALGAPPQRPASTPIDPATDAFVAQFVGATNDDGSGVVRTVSVTGASTTGGDRSGR